MIPSPGSVEKIASIVSFAFDFEMSTFFASFSANSSFVILYSSGWCTAPGDASRRGPFRQDRLRW